MKYFVMILSMALITTTLVSSCKKEDAPEKEENNTEDLTTNIVGNYMGSGENESGSFVNKQIKISKVSNTRIKVEPVNGDFLMTFEANIVKLAGSIVNEESTGDGGDIEFSIQTSPPYVIGIDIYEPEEQSFGGNKI